MKTTTEPIESIPRPAGLIAAITAPVGGADLTGLYANAVSDTLVAFPDCV